MEQFGGGKRFVNLLPYQHQEEMLPFLINKYNKNKFFKQIPKLENVEFLNKPNLYDK